MIENSGGFSAPDIGQACIRTEQNNFCWRRNADIKNATTRIENEEIAGVLFNPKI